MASLDSIFAIVLLLLLVRYMWKNLVFSSPLPQPSLFASLAPIDFFLSSQRKEIFSGLVPFQYLSYCERTVSCVIEGFQKLGEAVFARVQAPKLLCVPCPQGMFKGLEFHHP